jgi:hypothetical protein
MATPTVRPVGHVCREERKVGFPLETETVLSMIFSLLIPGFGISRLGARKFHRQLSSHFFEKSPDRQTVLVARC